MYPFGSGYPPNNQAPYPGAYPPSGQAPYPNAPFGAGYVPNQGGYPSNPPYPSQPSQMPGAYPPQGGNAYPPTNQPYPPAGGAYPPASGGAYPPTSGGAYPPASGGAYPPQPQSQAPYPTSQASYPQSQPPYPQSQQGYPPSQQPYPSQPGFMPSSTGSPYPSQTSSPYPNLGNQGGAPYPGSVPVVAHNYNTQSSAPAKKGTPTVVPATPFDPVSDANTLRKAMKGFGTDEDALINVICRRTNDQRQQIAKEFKVNYGKDLIENIKSETSGNFEKLLVSLMTPIVEFYVMQLHEAMVGAGTDEDVLIEIMCTLSNYEIETIKRVYHSRYCMALESHLQSETSGNFARLMVSLCAAGRDESGVVDMAMAQNDAQQLYQAGAARFGTDEAAFNTILCRRNYQQLKATFEEYEKLTGNSIENAIKSEFSGDIEEGLLSVVRCAINRPEYFARRLHKAMAGFGTNDNQLIRLLITRSEVDLGDVKVAFERKYGKSLKSWIKGEASGDYKNCLLALIGESK